MRLRHLKKKINPIKPEESFLYLAWKIFNSLKTVITVEKQTLQLLMYFFLKGFWGISCFYNLSFLRHLKFPGKIELLLTFDREMMT